jgi:hypothetical protein
MLNPGDLQSLGYLIGMCDDEEAKSFLSRIKKHIEELAQQSTNKQSTPCRACFPGSFTDLDDNYCSECGRKCR